MTNLSACRTDRCKERWRSASRRVSAAWLAVVTIQEMACYSYRQTRQDRAAHGYQPETAARRCELGRNV